MPKVCGLCFGNKASWCYVSVTKLLACWGSCCFWWLPYDVSKCTAAFFFLLPASISKLITAFFFRCKMIAYNTWIYGVSQCTYILILTDHATNTESVVRFHHLVLYYTQGLSSHHIVISVLEGRCEWTKKKKVEQLWAKPEAGGRGGGESQMCRLDPLETVGKMKGRGLVLCL